MNKWLFLLPLVWVTHPGCRPPLQKQVLVRVGSVEKTVQDAEALLTAVSPRTQAAWQREPDLLIVKLTQDLVLAAESLRAGLPVTRESIAAQMRTTLSTSDVSEKELHALFGFDPGYPYAPPRVVTQTAAFVESRDAERFARAARLGGGTRDAFDAAYDSVLAEHAHRQTRRSTSTKAWSLSLEVVRDHRWPWPHALIEPAFSAPAGAIVGPIAGETTNAPGARFFVMRVSDTFAELNSYESRRPALLMQAYENKVAEQVDVAIVKLVHQHAIVDKRVLADTLARLHL